MKNFIKTATASLSALVLAATMLFSIGGVATAASCYQYNANGFPTSTTPVFNNICGVPGYGDESNFVRIRPSNGNDMDASNNAAYTDSLDNACTDGSTFDVHTYIHNDAEPQYNNNGSGSAVAHNVQLAMSAPLGQTQNQFTFTNTLTADNAPTARDSATLNCGGQAVTLSLVPGSVNLYGTSYGWKNLTNVTSSMIASGTPFKIGDPTFGSGDEWGCWNYRMSVVYEVVVHVQQQQTSTGVCQQATFNIDDNNRTVEVSNIQGSVTNAQIIGYKIDFGDHTVVNQQSASHTYAQNGNYTITTYVDVQYANGSTQWVTASACARNVTFSSTPTPPPSAPPTTTTTSTPPTSLPNTGPGTTVGMFAGASLLAGLGHWLYRRRKLA